MNAPVRPVGDHLREWRRRRRMSQLELALKADISARHLSFLETGRARPSRDMILNLAERLDVPQRERNLLLLEAGFAPVYPRRALDDPALEVAHRIVRRILKGHEPYPALAFDRHGTLVAANGAIAPLIAGVDASLLKPPVNLLRLSLHPAGLAPRIENLREWRTHLLERLRRQIELTADAALAELLEELNGYPAGIRAGASRPVTTDMGGVAAVMRLATRDGHLDLLSTTTVFGTPVDVTLAELAIESFFPADDETAEMLRALFDSSDG